MRLGAHAALAMAACSEGTAVTADAPRGEPDAPVLAQPDAPPAVIDAPAGVVLPIFTDDYGAGLSYAPFGGSSEGPSIVATDPHRGTTALEVQVPASGYVGGAFRADDAHDLSGFTAVTFWARASKAAALDVVGLGNDATTNAHQVEWNAIALTTTWKRYVVPIPGPQLLTAEHGLFHVAEGAGEGAYTLWLDDVQYEVAPAGEIGAPRPAIATETVSRPVGQGFDVNGCSVTYAVDGADQTLATARPFFTFTSSHPEVATVDAAGHVVAVAPGSTTITAALGSVPAVGALTFEVTSP